MSYTRRKTIGGKKHRSSKKGSPSKTHKGRKNYTTKKGDKVFHRRKHYVRKSRKPYMKGGIGYGLSFDTTPFEKTNLGFIGTQHVFEATPYVGDAVPNLAAMNASKINPTQKGGRSKSRRRGCGCGGPQMGGSPVISATGGPGWGGMMQFNPVTLQYEPIYSGAPALMMDGQDPTARALRGGKKQRRRKQKKTRKQRGGAGGFGADMLPPWSGYSLGAPGGGFGGQLANPPPEHPYNHCWKNGEYNHFTGQ